jgi:hypothetical protein
VPRLAVDCGKGDIEELAALTNKAPSNMACIFEVSVPDKA